MVIRRHGSSREGGVLVVEAMVAMAILILATLPLSIWMLADARAFRDTYRRAVAVELVDGEMEILAAGDWRNYPEGTNACHIEAKAAANLPEGRFEVIRHENHLRLEWTPSRGSGIARVAREVTIR
jgi:hypothetical protein